PQGQVLVLLPGVPVKRQEVPLQGEVGGGGALSWFVDGEYLGSAPADERLWWRPTAGRHRVTVVDGAGRTAMRELQVREGLGGEPARRRRDRARRADSLASMSAPISAAGDLCIQERYAPHNRCFGCGPAN